jgi:hypothetical protein
MSLQLQSRGPVWALTLFVTLSGACALHAKQWRPLAAKTSGKLLKRPAISGAIGTALSRHLTYALGVFLEWQMPEIIAGEQLMSLPTVPR